MTDALYIVCPPHDFSVGNSNSSFVFPGNQARAVRIKMLLQKRPFQDVAKWSRRPTTSFLARPPVPTPTSPSKLSGARHCLVMSTKFWLLKAEPDSRIVKGKDVKVTIDLCLSDANCFSPEGSSVWTTSSASRRHPGKAFAAMKREI